MPNWAFTRNAFIGEKKDLEKFRDSIQTAINNATSTKLCDKEWLGHIVKAYGLDTQQVICKGNVLCMYFEDEPTLHLIVETQDAWYANDEMWRTIIKKAELPIQYHYCTEEPMNDTFAKSKGSEVFFPEKYKLEINIIDDDPVINYCKTDEEVINTVNKYTKLDFNNISDIKKFIHEMDDPIENIESIRLLEIEIDDETTNDNLQQTKEMTRCTDCAYLYEDEDGKWICDDWQKEIGKIPDEDCALMNNSSSI